MLSRRSALGATATGYVMESSFVLPMQAAYSSSSFAYKIDNLA